MKVSFVKSPLNGHIGLPLGTPIKDNQDFTLGVAKNISTIQTLIGKYNYHTGVKFLTPGKLSEVASLVYCHDDSETKNDVFTIIARDPKENKSNLLDIHVRVTPINDHQAEFKNGLVTHIYVEENGENCLSLRNIDVHDFDTSNSELFFTGLSSRSSS